MKCKRCSKQLMSLVQDELSADARAEVEAHLGACSACAEELLRLEATLELLDQQPDLEPSEGFDAGFARKLAAAGQQDGARENRRSWWRLPVLATAVAGACAVVVALAVTRVSAPPRSHERVGEMELIRELDLLQSYDVVNNLDGLEDYDVVMSLDSLMEKERGQ